VRTQVFKVKNIIDPNQKFGVNFCIHFKCNLGQSMGVMGSTPETGVWKDLKYHLKWTKGNYWKSASPLMVSKSYFKYKYVVVQQGKIVEWEQGIDRIADCAVLPEIGG
jgi:hypothetical protein